MPGYTPFKEEHHLKKYLPNLIAKTKEFVRKLQVNLKNEASGISIASIADKAERLRLRTREQLQQAQALSLVIDKQYKEKSGEISEKTYNPRLRYLERSQVPSRPKEQETAIAPKKERYLSDENFPKRTHEP